MLTRYTILTHLLASRWLHCVPGCFLLVQLSSKTLISFLERFRLHFIIIFGSRFPKSPQLFNLSELSKFAQIIFSFLRRGGLWWFEFLWLYLMRGPMLDAQSILFSVKYINLHSSASTTFWVSILWFLWYQMDLKPSISSNLLASKKIKY